MSRPSHRPPRHKNPGVPAQRDIPMPQQELGDPASAQPATTPPNHQDVDTKMTLLNVLKGDLDDMRHLIMCKICIRPLYEPFSLGCGHTYCYTCLSEWFASRPNRRKRNCPDCRAEVLHQPAPNYSLRELVHLFVTRAELLPDDENLQEHQQAMLSEARQLEKDKNDKSSTGGLFKGLFKHSDLWTAIHRTGIEDLDDGVTRCPRCAWELEDGICEHCGFDVAGSTGFSDEEDQRSYSTDYDGRDFGDSDVDEDMEVDEDDGFGYDFDVHHVARYAAMRFGRRRIGASPHSAISVNSDSEDDVQHPHGWETGRPRRFRPVLDDEEDDEEEDEDHEAASEEMRSFIDDDEGDEEEDADDQTVRTWTPRSPVFPPSSVSSDIHETGGVEYSSQIGTSVVSDDEEENEDEEEEDIPAARKVASRPLRHTRLVIDSDSEEELDDDDDGVSTARETNGNMSDDGVSATSSVASTSSSTPPQSAAHRRARRQAQRTRSQRRRA